MNLIFKSFAFTCLTLLIATNLKGQNLQCEKFRNGLFKIAAHSGIPETQIIRKGNVQVENIKNVEGTSEFVVKWLNDSTYTLKPTKKTLKRIPELPKNALLTVKIIEVKENSYIQTSTSNFADYELTSEVIKIN